jgi:hypothetical protein
LAVAGEFTVEDPAFRYNRHIKYESVNSKARQIFTDSDINLPLLPEAVTLSPSFPAGKTGRNVGFSQQNASIWRAS